MSEKERAQKRLDIMARFGPGVCGARETRKKADKVNGDEGAPLVALSGRKSC